jgi:hypothetical protein
VINVFEVPSEHVDACQQLLKRALGGEVGLDGLYAGSQYFLSLAWLASELPATVTRAPAVSAASAMPRPIPLAPPMTTT